MTRALHTSNTASVIRWVFAKGRRALSCEVRIDSRGSFEVCVVPLWDVKASVIESFDRATLAMRRHAEIAAAFRQAGWVAARQPGRSPEVAA